MGNPVTDHDASDPALRRIAERSLFGTEEVVDIALRAVANAPDDDDATLADTLDALDDVAHTLWALVDDLTPHIHAENDAGRRYQLRIVGEHLAQSWAQAQHALVTLRALLALDATEVP